MYALNYQGGGSPILGPYNDMDDAIANSVPSGKLFYIGIGGLAYGKDPGTIMRVA